MGWSIKERAEVIKNDLLLYTGKYTKVFKDMEIVKVEYSLILNEKQDYTGLSKCQIKLNIKKPVSDRLFYYRN